MSKPRLKSLIVFGAATLIATVVFLASRPDRVLRVLTSLTSHTLCSAAFVSGLDPHQVYAETIAPTPGIKLISWAVHYKVDTAHREVRTTLAGGFESRAVYRDGLGCLVLHGDPAVDPVPPRDTGEARDPSAREKLGPEPVTPGSDKVRAVFDRVFANPHHPHSGWLKAVVVMRDGQVVAERYAKGYGSGTPVLGWSVTKSVVNALVGILVRQGRLSVERPASVPEWRDPSDPRSSITIDHLLRMTSGLDIEESNGGFDPVSRMLFLERDMAAFAARAPLKAAPGTKWNYTSGNTLILSRIIRDAVGGHAGKVLEFARHELFEPLGMATVTLEQDATGTPVGSTYMFASARDWARFGTLYLNDGVVGGRRILPLGWVRYSSSPTLNSGYAAGFWLKRDRGMPADSFYASGYLGQEIAVIPSERLVVASFSVIHEGLEELDPLVKAVSAALGSHAK